MTYRYNWTRLIVPIGYNGHTYLIKFASPIQNSSSHALFE